MPRKRKIKYELKKMSIKSYKPRTCPHCLQETRDLWRFGTVTHLTYQQALKEQILYELECKNMPEHQKKLGLKPEDVYSHFGSQRGIYLQ
tara:strand:+ start:632 stop:901 length:270 start_codon:yes stop_codon:yes gene_type:complete